jgi:ubiquinone/menaquinone biosynthesis C-methylase UbiE
LNDFDPIASWYDRLGQIVFFDRLHIAQKEYLNQLKQGNSLLILGGGTGRILEDIDRLGLNLNIDFVEPSSEMIKKAKQRGIAGDINFHQLSFSNFHNKHQYDWVYCPFFLDLFGADELNSNLRSIGSMLKEDGQLLVVDFQIADNKWWQLGLSKLMHWFFGKFAQLQSKNLMDIRGYVEMNSFKLIDGKSFFGGFIFSEVYHLKSKTKIFRLDRETF